MNERYMYRYYEHSILYTAQKEVESFENIRFYVAS